MRLRHQNSNNTWILNFVYHTAPTNVAVEGKVDVNQGEVLSLKCSFKEGSEPATKVDYRIDGTVVKSLKPVSFYILN